MRGVRNTGFVVSLALLASLVGHFAIQKHFERRTRGMIARLSSESASPSDTSLFHSSRPPALFDRSTAPHLLDDTPSPGQVISALGVHERFTGGRAQVVQAQQTENPPTTVPAPTDAAPVDASLSDSSHEAEIHPGDANAVRNVIEHELSHATREEREIWYDELKSLPAGVVRDLLQVRKQIRALPRLLGGIPEKLASTDSSISNRTHEIAAEPASQKIRFSVPDQLFATTAMEAAISQLRHNLANAATPGYKRLRVMLVDSYVQSSLDTNGLHDPQTEPSPGANFQGEGCRLAPLLLDLKQGLLKKTGRQLDLAITGEGFFVVRRGEREFLTRCGAFTLDRNRFLCLANSNDNSVLQPPICVPDDAHEIQVSADGIVSAVVSGETTPTAIGSLSVARVSSPARLRPTGDSLFVANEESGGIVLGKPLFNGHGEIHQGVLEQSNVDVENEREEIEELMTILKSLPSQNSRPATASNSPNSPTH